MKRLISFVIVALTIAAGLPIVAQTPATYGPPPCTCTPPPPPVIRPFDLYLPLGTVQAVVPGTVFKIVYYAPANVAALINLQTGQWQFQPLPANHAVLGTFDAVEVVSANFFIWHSGTKQWGQPWHTDWPWTNINDKFPGMWVQR